MRSTHSASRLHLIGYVSTALIALQLLIIGWLALVGWRPDRIVGTALRESEGIREGPLSARRNMILAEADRLLTKLPSLSTLGQDGMRLVAMPSFGSRWFAVAVRRKGREVDGVLVWLERSNDGVLGAETRRAFSMPAAAYQAMVAHVDRFHDSQPEARGSTGTVRVIEVDGTPFAFERMHAGNVRSGLGNGGYAELAAALRSDLAPYLPPIAALDADWMGPPASP